MQISLQVRVGLQSKTHMQICMQPSVGQHFGCRLGPMGIALPGSSSVRCHHGIGCMRLIRRCWVGFALVCRVK